VQRHREFNAVLAVRRARGGTLGAPRNPGREGARAALISERNRESSPSASVASRTPTSHTPTPIHSRGSRHSCGLKQAARPGSESSPSRRRPRSPTPSAAGRARASALEGCRNPPGDKQEHPPAHRA
jgi:hypothetical protein